MRIPESLSSARSQHGSKSQVRNLHKAVTGKRSESLGKVIENSASASGIPGPGGLDPSPSFASL